jgi:hypothetical protein
MSGTVWRLNLLRVRRDPLAKILLATVLIQIVLEIVLLRPGGMSLFATPMALVFLAMLFGGDQHAFLVSRRSRGRLYAGWIATLLGVTLLTSAVNFAQLRWEADGPERNLGFEQVALLDAHGYPPTPPIDPAITRAKMYDAYQQSKAGVPLSPEMKEHGSLFVKLPAIYYQAPALVGSLATTIFALLLAALFTPPGTRPLVGVILFGVMIGLTRLQLTLAGPSGEIYALVYLRPALLAAAILAPLLLLIGYFRWTRGSWVPRK